MNTTTKYNFNINIYKSAFSLGSINIFGYTITDHIIKPDLENLQPLRNLSSSKDIFSTSEMLRDVLSLLQVYS